MNRLKNRSESKPSSLRGKLLIASPKFSGHPLVRGVILVLEHSEKGTKGILLNSLENEAVKQWCRSLAAKPDKRAVIEEVQAAAKSQQEQYGTPFTVCMEKPGHSLAEVIDQLGSGVRLFVGHVDWAGGKIEAEIAKGLWMCLPAFPKLLFGDHENLWATCVKCIGESVMLTASGVKPAGDAMWN